MLRFLNNDKRKNDILPFIVIFFGFSFFSCKTILLKFYGYHQPRIEDKESIINFCKKKGLIQDNIYCLDENDWYWAIKEKKIAKDIPEILVFDKSGKLIKYREDNQCNAKAFSFISLLSTDSKNNYDSLLMFNDLSEKLKDLNGDNVNIQIEDSTDYYIFIFWTLWTGRLNKDHVKVWENDAINNKNCNIRVYKVNMDMQKWWYNNKIE